MFFISYMWPNKVESIMKLISQLQNHEKLIGVWGLGYIGYSSMAHFSKQGIKCIGTDADEKITLFIDSSLAA